MHEIKRKNVFIFDTENDAYNFVIKQWAILSTAAIKKKGTFVVALSGGKTPLPLYERMAAAGDCIAYDKTHIFFVDERCVPYDDAESNYGMAKRTLFDNIKIPVLNIHHIPIEHDNHLSASRYEQELMSFFNGKKGEVPRFDLIMLGIGHDGHTASLFPGDTALSESRRLTCAVHVPHVKYDRVSITLSVINNAKNVLFLVRGREKASIVKDVIHRKSGNLPAAHIKPDNGALFIVLDAQAAALLEKGDNKI